MADSLFEKGREACLDGSIVYSTDTIKCALLDLNTADVGVKAVTGATNVTPIVITATAHGFANGDIVIIGGVGGNQAANGVWKIANQAANTFELTDPVTGANAAGSGAYTSGGYAVCLGPSAAGDNWDDFDGCLVGAEQTLGTKTIAGGVFGAANPTFPTVTGATVEALMIRKDTGTPSTSRVFALIDGRQIVTCSAQAAIAATTVAVERLRGGIPSGTVLAFSNGSLATLSALANAGDRTITVTALAAAITPGSRADAPITSSGLPVTPNGGNIAITFDAVNKIGKL